MRELIEKILNSKCEDYTIWHIEETRVYLFVRFTIAGTLHFMSYYKPNGSYEIFKLIAGGIDNEG